MSVLPKSTTAEIDAVERGLFEAEGARLGLSAERQPDGYYRSLAEDLLEKAKDARLGEFIAETEQELDRGRLQAVDSGDALEVATGDTRR